MDPVECDACLDEFVPKLYETRTKGGAWQRFACPHCRHVYDVAFVTTAALKLRPELQKARGTVRFRELQDRYQAEVLHPSEVAASR
jgi:transposase-like protein